MLFIRGSLVIFLLLISFTSSAEQIDVAALLRAKNYSQIEESLRIVQANFEIGELTEYELRNAFRPFYELDGLAEQNLVSWVSSTPQSYVARLGLGIYYKRRGGEARGNDFISKTPQANIDQMNRYYAMSENELRYSLNLTKKAYLSIFHLLDITSNSRDRSASVELLQKADEMLPNHSLVRNRYARYLAPRWGGSYEELDSFIARTKSQGVTASVIMQLQAIKYDDLGDTYLRRGEQSVAYDSYVMALQLAQKIGGTFGADFLPFSRYQLCTGSKISPYCN